MRVAFVIHGRFKNNQRFLKQLQTFLAAVNHQLFFTEYVGHGTALAREICEANFSHLIVCGGDGSLNEVVNGLIHLKKTATTPLPCLGILPMGTGNDFVKTIQSPKTLEGIFNSIALKKEMEVDVLLGELHDKAGNPIQRCCINIAEVGLGGKIAEKLSGSKKVLGAFLTFQYHIVATLFTYKKQPVIFKNENAAANKRMMNLVLANGKFFGGGLCVSPDSNLQDGLMNIVEMANVGALDYLMHLPDLRQQIKVKHPEVNYSTAKSIFIEAPSGAAPVDMDGELAGYTPLKLSVAAKALRFIC
jgi:diacylglycerol kinase (ATP)